METNSQPDQTESLTDATQRLCTVPGEGGLYPSDEQYRAILMALTDNVVVLDAEWRIQYINHVSPGLDEKEVLGSEWLSWLNEADRPRATQAIQQTLATGEPTEIEFRAVGPQRQMTWFQVKFARLSGAPAPRVVLIAQDITERRRAESKHRQITRLYATLSQINQTIVRVREPRELYHAICQVAVEYGEFALAWIGLLDHATGKVTPVVQAGANTSYVENLNIDLHDAATGYGPTGTALRTGKIVLHTEIPTEIARQSWHDHARAHNFQASVSVPFRLQGETIGTLNLYAREPFFFSAPDEMRLLEEIGLDISFALDKMQVEAEHQRAEQAVRESEARYCQLFDTSPDALFVLDAAGRFVDVNQVAVERYGYTRAELMQMTARDLAAPDLRDQTAARVRQTLVTGAQFEWRQQRKDGSEIPVEINARRITLNGQPCILSSVRDVTERKRIENELRKSRERYQNFVQQSYEAIYCTEFDEPIDTTLPIEEQIDAIYQNAYMGECNQAMAAMYGLTSPDAFVGQRMIDVHGGKDNPVNRATFRQFIEGDYRALNVETEEITSEGEHRWFISNNMGVVENGRLLRIWGTALDITERKRAEAQIIILARFPDENPNPVLRVNQQGVILYANMPSNPVLAEWQSKVGTKLPPDWCQVVMESMATQSRQSRDLSCGDRVISFLIVPIRAAGYVNLYGEDITERLHAEQSIRESEERLELVLEGSQLGYWDWNIETGVVHRNARWAEMLGYTLKEIEFSVKQWTDLHHPDDREHAQQSIRDHLAGKTPAHRCEYRMLAKDGQYKWILDQARVVQRDANGKPLRMSGTHTDITERKLAEETLRDSEASLRESQRVAHVGHWVWETPTNQVTWSDEMKRIFGLDPATFAGDLNEIIARAIHPDDQAKVNAANQAVLIEHHPAPLEYRVVLPDQSVRTILAVPGNKVVDARGTILKLTGIVQDITERKRAEEQLRHSEEQYRLLFQNNPNPMWVYDPETYAFLAVNDAAVRHYGYTREEFLAMTIKDMRPPEDVAALEHEVARLPHDLNETKVWRHCKKDGTVIAVEITSHWSEFAGKRARIVLANDVTERQRAETRVQRQVRHLDALRAIDMAISSNFNLNVTLDILLKQVSEQLGVDAATILLFNPNLLLLEFAAGIGFRSNAIRRAQVRLGESVAGKIAFERRLIHLPDLARADQPFAQRVGIVEEGFHAYAGVPLIAKGQIKGVLEIFHRAPLTMTAEWTNFLEMLAGQAAIAIDNAQLFENLQRSNLELGLAYDATIEGWSHALDLRDRETKGHTQRVVALTLKLARTLGIAESALVHMRRGALLHDIGKLGVPDTILFKPDQLTAEEWTIMREHPVFAYQMLAPIAYLRPALDIPYCHHEKWDGTGYPRQLKGEQIPLSARAFAIVDVWDALRSDRTYRKGWADDQVYDYLRAQAGAHFEPRIVDAFIKTVTRLPTLEMNRSA